MVKKGKKKAKGKSAARTRALLNNKILINIIMNKVDKRKSRARKGKARKTEPKAEHTSGQIQNQLAYINNLSIMNRVQPRMFLANSMQDRIDYKTQESIENSDIRDRIKMLNDAQTLQSNQMMALHQNMMNQSDMRAIMQNNSIAPSAPQGAHPVQNHLQVPYAQPQSQVQPDISPVDVGEEIEEIDAGVAPGNVTASLTQGENTSGLVNLYTEKGYNTTTASNNKLGGMFIKQLKNLMTQILDDQVNEALIIKYGIANKTKQISKDGLTLEGLAKDILDNKIS